MSVCASFPLMFEACANGACDVLTCAQATCHEVPKGSNSGALPGRGGKVEIAGQCGTTSSGYPPVIKYGNMAMENNILFKADFPIQSSIYRGFSSQPYLIARG